MKPMPATLRRTNRRSIASFLVLALALYAVAAVIADQLVARGAQNGPFQKLLAVRGSRVDLAVIGASHALPLQYGGLPDRLEAETGQRMVVLAEVGAGPLYALAVARQALHDLRPRRVLYVLDDFTFFAEDWNEGRLADRDALRAMPWRLSTAEVLGRMVLRHGVSPWAMIDYLTAFSKLNPPELFPQPGWVGAAGFERRFRPSRHAVASRVDYLYPNGTPAASADRYMDVLETMIRALRASGTEVEILRLPVSGPFRDALPDSADFEAALDGLLAALDVSVHDLRGSLDDPELFFDTDHLNRAGVDALYRSDLGDIFARPGIEGRR